MRRGRCSRRERILVSDAEIIELYQQRNELAISATNDSYGQYCYTIANRILCSAEDSWECVNDTWLRIWNSIPPHHPQCLRAFLAKITRNLAFDRFKREHAHKRGGGEIQIALDELEECVAAKYDVETEVLSEEMKRCIRCFLWGLSEQKRDVFLRRYFYLESTGAIAKHYDLKESNIRMILSRARKDLKKYLKKEGFFE